MKLFNVKHLNTRYLLYLLLLLPFGVAREAKTEMSNSLENYVREISDFNWKWQMICDTDLKDITQLFEKNDIKVELVSLTSGTLPENTVPQELLDKILIKAREFDPTYIFSYYLFEEMRTVFFANGIVGDQIFFIYLPLRGNREVESFCFGEWRN